MPHLTLSAVFGDHAVLQRNTDAALWGTAPAGAVVVVEFRMTFLSTTAGADGRWMLRMPTRDAGGPFELTVRCGEETLVVSDLLVGEVWLCSGQSNMAFALLRSIGGEEEAAAANIAKLRLFTHERRCNRHADGV